MAKTLLKARREQLGLTLREVDKLTRSAISHSYLSLLEHGRIESPSLAIAVALSTVYRVTLEEIAEMLGCEPRGGFPRAQAEREIREAAIAQRDLETADLADRYADLVERRRPGQPASELATAARAFASSLRAGLVDGGTS